MKIFSFFEKIIKFDPYFNEMDLPQQYIVFDKIMNSLKDEVKNQLVNIESDLEELPLYLSTMNKNSISKNLNKFKNYDFLYDILSHSFNYCLNKMEQNKNKNFISCIKNIFSKDESIEIDIPKYYNVFDDSYVDINLNNIFYNENEYSIEFQFHLEGIWTSLPFEFRDDFYKIEICVKNKFETFGFIFSYGKRIYNKNNNVNVLSFSNQNETTNEKENKVENINKDDNMFVLINNIKLICCHLNLPEFINKNKTLDKMILS